ncbi:MAG: CRISPR-associated protein Csx11, partial [Deltaproteobacteria bacterium]
MTGFRPADTLREHRPLLLTLEAIGWLHMTGKAKINFLRSHGGQSDYDYKKWHEQETPPFPWNDLLKWVQDKDSKNSPNMEWPDALTAFIREHAEDKSKPNLVGLLQAGHAMASGIEKQSFPQGTVRYLSQDVTHMWLSSAFGLPVRNLLADPPELLTDTGWKRLLGQIEGLLTGLKRLGDQGSLNNLDGWWRWREEAVGTVPEGWLRKAFTSTLAETRLPNNDVTLFDQSYVAAALFKSAAAGAILEGKSFPWTNNSLKQQTRWRLLTVGIGADHYEARAVKIGDWTGARLALDEFF